MDIPVTGIYSVQSGTISAIGAAGPKTLLQYTAPSTKVAVLIRVDFGNINSETSTQEEYDILRQTTAGTGGASVTPAPLGGYAAAAGTALSASTAFSAEPTASTVVWRDTWNIVTGVTQLFLPEERIIVPPSGRIAVRFPTALEAAIDVNVVMTIAEIG
jgi:hypothetical protein